MRVVSRAIPSWSTLRVALSSPRDRTPVMIAVSALVFATVVDGVTGGSSAAVMTVVTAACVLFAARAAAATDDRHFVVPLAVTALLVRAVGAGLLHAFLLSSGRNGAMFFDDAGYMQLAEALARGWRGLPISADARGLLQDSSIANFYVSIAGVVYLLTGSSALALKLLNNAFEVGMALLTYRTMVTLGLPGARFALAGLLVFPSLVLWSALALKDSFILFLVALVIWCAAEAAKSRRVWPWYLLIAVALLPLESTRRFLFLILVIAWPVATSIVTPRFERMRMTAFSAAVAVCLIASTSAWGLLAPGLLSAPEFVRSAMAQGARSAYVEPPPLVRVEPGDRFRVAVAGQTAPPPEGARIVYVVPGTELVLSSPSAAPGSTPPPTSTPAAPLPTSGRPIAVVGNGDIVVVVQVLPSPGPTATGAPASPTAPTATEVPPTELRVSREQRNIVAAPTAIPPTEALAIGRDLLTNLQYLPIGLAYVVAAPFPWAARSLADLATIPEMLLWYVAEALAVVGLVYLARRRDVSYAYGILVLAAVGLVLCLAEGNVGTLFRHRSMLIPEVVVLASIGLMSLLRSRATGARRPLPDVIDRA